MERKLAGWLQSSQDPTEVGNKVKGLILGVSSILILVSAQVFHFQLAANDVVTLATEIGTVAGAVWTIYGAVLHLVTLFGSKQVPPSV